MILCKGCGANKEVWKEMMHEEHNCSYPENLLQCTNCGWQGYFYELAKKYTALRDDVNPELCCPKCDSQMLEGENDKR